MRQHLVCPHCSQEIDLFKKGGRQPGSTPLEFLGAIPLDPATVVAGDWANPWSCSTSTARPSGPCWPWPTGSSRRPATAWRRLRAATSDHEVTVGEGGRMKRAAALFLAAVMLPWAGGDALAKGIYYMVKEDGSLCITDIPTSKRYKPYKFEVHQLHPQGPGRLQARQAHRAGGRRHRLGAVPQARRGQARHGRHRRGVRLQRRGSVHGRGPGHDADHARDGPGPGPREPPSTRRRTSTPASATSSTCWTPFPTGSWPWPPTTPAPTR